MHFVLPIHTSQHNNRIILRLSLAVVPINIANTYFIITPQITYAAAKDLVDAFFITVVIMITVVTTVVAIIAVTIVAITAQASS
jgi:hypothetical protein